MRLQKFQETSLQHGKQRNLGTIQEADTFRKASKLTGVLQDGRKVQMNVASIILCDWGAESQQMSLSLSPDSLNAFKLQVLVNIWIKTDIYFICLPFILLFAS